MKRNFYLFVISLLFVSGAFQMKEVFAENCDGSKCTWTEFVSATNSNPTSSGLRRSSNETRIYIMSGGTANRGGGNPTTGPTGEVGKTYNNAIQPQYNIGALLVKTGNYYYPVGGGIIWNPPTDDVIEFIYNDTYGGFGNNTGGYRVTIEYTKGDLR
jgi:hypothetical protein